MFKQSTQPQFRSPSHGGNLNRSASLSCTERAPESGSVGGSNTQIPGTPFQYIPDFCVRALTDLQFVKPHSSGHIHLSAARDATRDTHSTAAGHAPREAPTVQRAADTTGQPHHAGPHHLHLLQPQAKPVPAAGHAPSKQPHLPLPTPPSSMSTAPCSLNPHPTLKPSQPSPPSAGPENGPGETTTLLSEQQNCVGPAGPATPRHTPTPTLTPMFTPSVTHTLKAPSNWTTLNSTRLNSTTFALTRHRHYFLFLFARCLLNVSVDDQCFTPQSCSTAPQFHFIFQREKLELKFRVKLCWISFLFLLNIPHCDRSSARARPNAGSHSKLRNVETRAADLPNRT
ncbi:hypothetical protein INR49_007289 [Caranx melampygus]|nr:hypothetical protein INR49_007289 [Caranx melampygus]